MSSVAPARIVDVLVVPVRTMFRDNPAATWASIGLSAGVGFLVPYVGTYAAAILFMPVLATVFRASAAGQKIKFQDAWDLSTPIMLRFLAYSLLFAAIAVGLLSIGGMIFFTAASSVVDSANPWPEIGPVILGLATFFVLIGVPLTWLSTVVLAGVSARVPSPWRINEYMGVGRSIAGWLLASVVYFGITAALLIPIALAVIVSDEDRSIALLVLGLLGMALTVVVGQITSALIIPGLAVLVHPDQAGPVEIVREVTPSAANTSAEGEGWGTVDHSSPDAYFGNSGDEPTPQADTKP